MSDVVFVERSQQPTEARLEETLGRAKAHWDTILAHTGAVVAGLHQEWRYYGRKYGWIFKLACAKRALLYLSPKERCFTASTALKEPAVAVLRERHLPEALVQEIENAKAHPEGRPARVRVGAQKDVVVVKKLLALKLER